MDPVFLGPFSLHEPIGDGASGVVYRARHEAQGLWVAIKVLAPEVAADPQQRAAFLREARAAARLDHPALIPILDLGEVGTESPELTPGSPWLAMPLAQGTLGSEPSPATWPEARAVLDRLLSGLAHAHARGVVHRDLKPANVLVFEGTAADSACLADFGVAVLRGETGAQRVAGTVSYMAPEQLRGDLDQIGPWTDLYALGCLAWELISGVRVRGAGTPTEIARRHLFDRLPALRPRFDVPHEVEGWLATLLEPSTDTRFRFAADARLGLSRLGASVPGTAGSGLPIEAPSQATLSLDALDTLGEAQTTAGPGPGAPEHRPIPTPPIPESIGAALPPMRPMALLGAGLRLVPLRDHPVVGRVREREHLLGLLREVAASGRMSLALLEGSTGVGKSRLARWLVELAAEQGLAHTWTVRHGRGGAAEEGVEGLLRQAGLSAEGPASARWERIRWLIGRELSDRPGLIWLDDVQHGLDALGLVRHLLVGDRLEPLPLLVVMTAQSEELAADPVAAAAVDALRPEARCRTVGPMHPGDRALLTQMLRLRPGQDALRVEAASGGNPMIAVQLVEQALGAGALVAGSEGFELQVGADLPRDLHEIWRRRVQTALAGWPGDRAVVAAAAVLGELVSAEEWATVVRAIGAEPDPRPMELLLSAGLIEPHDAGWRFVHGLARAAAEGEVALEPLHLAAAAAVPAQMPWRRARHLLAGGRDAEALDPLLDALVALGEVGRLAEAEGAYRHFEAAAARVGLPESDLRRGRAMVVSARLQARLGRTDRSAALVDRLTDGIARHGWAELEAAAAYGRGDLAMMRGQPEVAGEELARSIALAEAAGNARLAVGARNRLAHLHVMNGRLDEAIEALIEAVAAFDLHRALVPASVACSWLASAEYSRQNSEQARRWALEAVRRAAEVGEQSALGHAYCVLGNAALQGGDPAAAVEAWEHSARRYDALGSPQASIPRINLAAQYWRDGRVDDAERVLSASIATLERMGQHSQALEARCRRLCWTDDEAEWDAVLDAVDRNGLDQRISVAEVLDDAWEADPGPVRRRRLAEISLGIYERRGDPRAEHARARLGTTPPS